MPGNYTSSAHRQARIQPNHSLELNMFKFVEPKLSIIKNPNHRHPSLSGHSPGRARTTQRLDAGLKRGNDESKETMSNWLKKRRGEVGDLAQKAADANPDLLKFPEDDMAGWTDQHQEELEFQRGKQEAHLIEAYQDNCLLPSDANEEEIKNKATEASIKCQKKDKELVAARKKKEQVDLRNDLRLDLTDFTGSEVWTPGDDDVEIEPWFLYTVHFDFEATCI